MGDLHGDLHEPAVAQPPVGEELGEGKTIEEMIEEMGQVAEGVKTAAW